MKFTPLTTAEIIATKFPGRVVLTPEEVAEVWKGKTTRGVVGGIREKLKKGSLIPNLRKNGGRWHVPVSDLIKAIDALASAPSAPFPFDYPQGPTSIPPRRRKRSPIPKGRVGVFD